MKKEKKQRGIKKKGRKEEAAAPEAEENEKKKKKKEGGGEKKREIKGRWGKANGGFRFLYFVTLCFFFLPECFALCSFTPS